MAYLLTENMVNTVALYMILKKIMLPFEDWPAYRLGIIDKEGKKLKEPVTAKERESWDLLTKFVWNFKKVIMKFVGKSKFATYLSASYLLRDGISKFYIDYNKESLDRTLLKEMTFNIQTHLFELTNQLPDSEKVSEDNFEYLMLLYTPKVEKFLENNPKILSDLLKEFN